MTVWPWMVLVTIIVEPWLTVVKVTAACELVKVMVGPEAVNV